MNAFQRPPASGPIGPGPIGVDEIPPVTNRNVFSKSFHEQIRRKVNSLWKLRINPPSLGQVLRSDLDVMIDLTGVENNANSGGGLTGPYTLTNVHPDYLTATLSGTSYSIAKPFKLWTSLTSVVEFGVTSYFFYGDGSSTAQGSALFAAFGITPDGQNVMRLKTTDATQAAFPTTTALTANTGAGGGYVRSMGELEMALPIWATSSPADLIFAVGGNTGLTDLGGAAINFLSVADDRQWAKIDQAGPVYGGTFANPNGNIAPADPTTWNIYYQDGAAKVWTWSVASQNWFEVV